MSRTYRDPIHQEITLNSEDPVESLIIRLIDSREFQRLRWIRQLGVSWFTYHGAEHSRFPHSLGAMYIVREMFKQVSGYLYELGDKLGNFQEEDFDNHRAAVLCAALLHDIGHGPFSHSCEQIINIQHEEWSKKLILSGETEVNKLLKEFDPELPNRVVAILEKTYPIKFLSDLVNSQLDCDRFDYLVRDSYQTGTSYGNFDLNRVISSLSVNTEKDQLVVSGEKGMLAVEDYLYARYSMYLQVYQHKKALATDTHLRKLFERVKLLARHKKISFIEDEIFKWITKPESLTIKEFLEIDDINILHHIKHWARERDMILKDLSQRFLARKLFKANKLEGPSTNGSGQEESKATDLNEEELYKVKYDELKTLGLDPEFYMDKISIASNPYSFYDPSTGDKSKAIFVDYDGQLKEISEVSSVVKSLVSGNFEHKWLISA